MPRVRLTIMVTGHVVAIEAERSEGRSPTPEGLNADASSAVSTTVVWVSFGGGVMVWVNFGNGRGRV